MEECPTIRDSIRWAFRQWRTYLQRDGAVVALVLLLSVGAGEPLLCILHCHLWMPFASPMLPAGHQHHHNGVSARQETRAAAPAGAASIDGLPRQLSPLECFLHMNPSRQPGESNSAFSSPVHDSILALGVALPGIVLLFRAPPQFAPLRPTLTHPPPLPPPIALIPA